MPGTRRIAVIDDDAFFCGFVETTLGREGWTVSACHSGAEGVALLGRPAPSLVLLDLSLPDLSGLDVLKLLRGGDNWSAVPIVMLTAARDDEYMLEARRRGATGYLMKPISPADLVTAVAELLASGNLTWIDDVTRAYRRG